MSSPSAYRRRVLDAELDALMPQLPAIAIEGAKGVGKTFTASQRAGSQHLLDDPGQLAVARADPARLLTTQPPILLDEWQRLPETWDLVRRAVDHGESPGRFLLTGSASPKGPGTHSGAGRIVSLRMRPLSLAERTDGAASVSLARLAAGERPGVDGATDLGLEGYVRQILASGFPGLRGLEGRALRAQLDGYLRRVVDRDLPELGQVVRNPSGLWRWMTAYAAASSTTASFETIRDASTAGTADKPARSTVIPYRDVLERLWILDPVPAWQPTRSRIGRLAHPPKHQLADPALAVQLLGVDAEALLAAADVGPPVPRDGTLLGALFESLVTLSVRAYAQAAEARVFHLRTRAGEREVDLIIERPDGRVVGMEVKLAATIHDRDVRHLTWLRDTIGPELVDAVVVSAGAEAYRRRDGIAVVPAALLGP